MELVSAKRGRGDPERPALTYSRAICQPVLFLAVTLLIGLGRQEIYFVLGRKTDNFLNVRKVV